MNQAAKISFLGVMLCRALPAADLDSLSAGAAGSNSFAVHLRVNTSTTTGQFTPIWRFFGADEPNYATMVHGRKLISELGAMAPKRVYFRAHNLLTSGDGTASLKWGSTGVYAEKANGEPTYYWDILDRIFDTYLQSGVRPYVEVGFMPEALSIKPEPYRHQWNPKAPYDSIFTGWAYPPKDYAKWRELVFQWTSHCIERYGRAEVESWYWEVWNEANIGYWRGTLPEFLKLHDYAIDGVRRALPTARVGGADSAGSGGRFTRTFLEHCLRGTNYATGRQGTPLDFISFHAKGSPVYVENHVRMGIAAQLRTIDEGFRLVGSFPELKNKPIIIGESDPEGCAACQGPSLAYRNGTMYSSYTAAVFARKYELAAKHGVNLEGALTWAFEFEGQPYFAGFRSLASNGLDKPVLNVFRMFSHMRGEKVPVESDCSEPPEKLLVEGVRLRPDIGGLASLDGNKLCILVWHYHDDDLPGPSASVELKIDHIPSDDAKAIFYHYRIDENTSNAFAAWKRLGSPQQPTSEQYSQLEKAGRLATVRPIGTIPIAGGQALLNFDLPRQGVSLLEFTWPEE
jgi:xylan 1,4-beta-xylosidase